jgi:hypothetical protein
MARPLAPVRNRVLVWDSVRELVVQPRYHATTLATIEIQRCFRGMLERTF